MKSFDRLLFSLLRFARTGKMALCSNEWGRIKASFLFSKRCMFECQPDLHPGNGRGACQALERICKQVDI